MKVKINPNKDTKEKRERNMTMYAKRKMGATLESLGAEYGLTIRAVSSILKRIKYQEEITNLRSQKHTMDSALSKVLRFLKEKGIDYEHIK